MARLINRVSHGRAFEAFRTDPARLQQALADSDPTTSLSSWLQRLGKLFGVPLTYLVPNEHMLPNESIRFFNVDFNWIFALIEGAASIGQSNTADAAIQAVSAPKLRAASSITAAPGMTAPATATGFMMRSQVVAGWPNLQLVPYDKHGVQLTNVLRMERITDSILLFMIEGQIDHVIIREPAVGLHFGIDVAGGKFLRYVTVPATAPEGTRPGDQIADASVTPQFRDASHRTIRINTLAGDLAQTLYQNQADNAPDGTRLAFTSAEFALQLVEGTQEVTFQNVANKDG